MTVLINRKTPEVSKLKHMLDEIAQINPRKQCKKEMVKEDHRLILNSLEREPFIKTASLDLINKHSYIIILHFQKNPCTSLSRQNSLIRPCKSKAVWKSILNKNPWPPLLLSP